jgi:hypothetical protein
MRSRSSEREYVMAVFNGAYAIRAGKESAARAWIDDLGGARRDGYVAMQRRSGMVRETLALQSTPQGTLLLVWLEGDLERSFEDLATSDDEFMIWHRAQILDVLGSDVTAPDDAPAAELIFDWQE